MLTVMRALGSCVRAASRTMRLSSSVESSLAGLEASIAVLDQAAGKDFSQIQRVLAVEVLGASDFVRRANSAERKVFSSIFDSSNALRGWLHEAAGQCGSPDESISLYCALQALRAQLSSSQDPLPTSPRTLSLEAPQPARVLRLKRLRLREKSEVPSPFERSRPRADYEKPKNGASPGGEGGTFPWRSASDLLRTCVEMLQSSGNVSSEEVWAARSLILPAQIAASIEAEDTNI
ncbi:unnamed protein product [Phytomonas sp. Hart1]|nr:unnamed protein product [Phytomonas sp. Hart1]|eukprot:CCW68026.1 unnamed protein product [Phytomonas sp. isolate Hart1]